MMNTLRRTTLAALAALALAACSDRGELTEPSASPNASLDAGGSPGAVYAMTNDATNNQVVVLNRGADGRLTPAGSFPTGG